MNLFDDFVGICVYISHLRRVSSEKINYVEKHAYSTYITKAKLCCNAFQMKEKLHFPQSVS